MRRIMIGVLICILFSVWALVHGVFAANYGPQQTVIVARDITDALTLDPNLVYERSGFIADHNIYSNLITFVGGNLTQPRGQVARSWEVSQDV
jgi:peptide/nickel transport system substrate-binding protein